MSEHPKNGRGAKAGEPVAGAQRGAGTAVAAGGSGRRRFGGDLSSSELGTRRLERNDTLASPDQKIEALLAVLLIKGVVTREEYETQLAAVLGNVTKAGDAERE